MKESEGKKSLATEEIERDLHRFSFVMYSAVQRHANIKNAAFNSDHEIVSVTCVRSAYAFAAPGERVHWTQVAAANSESNGCYFRNSTVPEEERS